MKAILTFGLLLASLTTYSQYSEGFSHKDLGLGYSLISYTSSLDTQSVASPRDLLNADPIHKAMVRAFASRFPGQDSVVLSSSLLDSFAATRNETPGVNLFLGRKKGRLQVIITNTRIDTLKVNDTFTHEKDASLYDSASNYNALYDQAYYLDKGKRNLQLVKSKGRTKGRNTPTGEGTLKQDILNSRKRAHDNYGYQIQGYYLSKDLLLKIRKQSGQESLTVFLGQAADVFHLIIPIFPKTPSDPQVIHYATDYEKTFQLDLVTHPSRGPAQGPPPPKDHNTIRPCPPYCGI